MKFAELCAGALALVPMGLWVSELPGPLWRLDSPAAWQTLGQLPGILGVSLFAASLCLMLRLTWLDRLFGGLDRVYLTHHRTGACAYLLLLSHPLMLAAGQWAVTPQGASEFLRASIESPEGLTGWVALVILMGVLLATFAWKLPYARWKQVHLASAVAYAFSIGHVVLVTPGPLTPSDTALFVYLGLGVAALGYRLLMDTAQVQRHEYRVEAVSHLSGNTVRIQLEPLRRPLRFKAGQFIFAAFYDSAGYKGCHEYHPFTISSSPDEISLSVIIKALGDCTGHIQTITPGVVARIQGPFGRFLQDADGVKQQVWIAGGIGITPFLSTALSLTENSTLVDLYYVTRNHGEAIDLDDLRQCAARNPRFRVFTLTADSNQNTTLNALRANSAPLPAKQFFLCGPPPMVNELIIRLQGLGVPASHIHSERFDFR
jgi:predicted ferric reductase